MAACRRGHREGDVQAATPDPVPPPAQATALPDIGERGGTKAAAIEADYDALTGTWQLVKSVVDGEPVPEAEVKKTVLITDHDEFRFPADAGVGTAPLGKFTIDPFDEAEAGGLDVLLRAREGPGLARHLRGHRREQQAGLLGEAGQAPADELRQHARERLDGPVLAPDHEGRREVAASRWSTRRSSFRLQGRVRAAAPASDRGGRGAPSRRAVDDGHAKRPPLESPRAHTILAAMAAILFFTFQNWRCPACQRTSERGQSRFCPRCGVPLR